jgi:hypothetical protein
VSRRKRPHVNPRVKGKPTKSTHAERLEYARKEWERDPKISVMGGGGMHARCKEIFGVSPTYEQLREVRTAVAQKQREAYKAKLDAEDRANKHPVLTPEKAKKLLDPVGFGAPPEPSTEGDDNVLQIQQHHMPPALRARLQEENAGRKNTERDREIRQWYAITVYSVHPRARQEQVRATLRARFGRGIGNAQSGELRLKVHETMMEDMAADYFKSVPGLIEMSSRRHIVELAKKFRAALPMGHERCRQYATVHVQGEQERRRLARRGDSPPPAPAEDEKKKEAPVRKSATSQENVRTALQMIRDEIPDLSRLELVVPRDGKPTVSIERHTVEQFGLEGDEL